jgi:hypothetical protein
MKDRTPSIRRNVKLAFLKSGLDLFWYSTRGMTYWAKLVYCGKERCASKNIPDKHA